MTLVIEIVKAHLIAGGYGGLVTSDGDCGCEVADLVPCDADCSQCEPGYKHMDPRADHKGDWSIWKQKEPPTADQWAEIE